jgi:GTPase SAR1 family protein
MGRRRAAATKLRTQVDPACEPRWNDRVVVERTGHEAGGHEPVRPLGALRGITRIARIAWSADGRLLAAVSSSRILRVWDSATGLPVRDLRMEAESIRCLAYAPDGDMLAVGTRRGNIQLWSTSDGRMTWELSGHRGAVSALAWSPAGKMLASGSDDLSVRLWDMRTHEAPWTFHQHREPITDVAWSPTGDLIGSSSGDGSLLLWSASNGELVDRIATLRSGVLCFAWSHDSHHLAIGTEANTIHVWDSGLGRIRVVLEGHARPVNSVAFSPDGSLLASRSTDGNIRVWRLDSWELVASWEHHFTSPSLCNIAFHPMRLFLASIGDDGAAVYLREIDADRLLEAPALPETARYVNAKVMLVGDSGVGKSGLSLVLCGNRFEATDSTHARKVARLSVPQTMRDEVGREETREIFLWDLAGQPGYRLVHQLSLGEVDVALVVFDGASETDEFAGVKHWVRSLQQAQQLDGTSARTVRKFLVAARLDRGSLRVSRERIEQLRRELGFEAYFETSAKESLGIEPLLTVIRETIAWDQLPRVTTTSLYRRIREFFVEQKLARRYLVAEDELFGSFLQHSLERDALHFQFMLCLDALETAGAIRALLGEQRWIVLRPELIEPCEQVIHDLIADSLPERPSQERWLVELDRLHDNGRLPPAFAGLERMYVVELVAAVFDQRQTLARGAAPIEAAGPPPSPNAILQDLDSQIRSFIMSRKESQRVAAPLLELFDAFVATDFRAQFASCVRRLESAGSVKQLSFGRLVLLQPELLDAYASGIVNAATRDADGLGSLLETTVREGRHGMPRSERISDPAKESLLLIATIEDLLRHEVALREESDVGQFLVFPSQLTRERPDLPDPRGKAVVFSFQGPVQSIYATLVVRLSHSTLFKRIEMWKDATTYRSLTGDTCGVFVRELEGGQGQLTLFFEGGASPETRLNFEEYVHTHLQRRALAGTIGNRRLVICPTCDEVFPETMIRKRLERGTSFILCGVDGTRVPLAQERAWEPPEPESKVWVMERRADEHRARAVAEIAIDGKRATDDFDVFVAYNAGDTAAVRSIVVDLKQRGLNPWIDTEQIAPGRSFQDTIQQAIPRTRSAAFVIGHQGVGRWQAIELQTLIARYVEIGRPVIPVLLPGVVEVPATLPFLGQFNRVEFRSLPDHDALDRLEWGITGRRPLPSLRPMEAQTRNP